VHVHVLFYALSLLSRHLKTFDDALRAGCDPCLFFLSADDAAADSGSRYYFTEM